MCGIQALCILYLCLSVTQSADLYLKVNSDDVRGPFKHFWRSTGFCPPLPHQKAADFDLSNDILQNLAYIGAVPHRGIEQVRIHWLLDLVTVSGYTTTGPIYNLTNLDKLVNELYLNGLKPGFEVMGNPSNIFTDFENKTQVYMWRDMVKLVATSYIQRYGLDYVKTWNFEVWNEPDCRDFDMKMTNQGFANYYDATSEGLKQADPSLIFGGPGGGCDKFQDSKHGTYEEYLLEHVVNGQNYFTGETGVRLDFLSLHRKGYNYSSNIIREELSAMKYIADKYPSLAHKPFYNDESDPLVGWSKNLTWRAGSIYAAMVVKIIAQHQNMFIANADSPINYQLLSNDNGFLSYYPHQFTQRTLLARFQINNTTPHYTTFIQKPVHSAFCLLSLLGDYQVYVDAKLKNDSEEGVIVTVHKNIQPNSSDSWQMSILVYYSDDTHHGRNYGLLDLDWYINPPNSSQELMLVSYMVSALGNDPYGVWSGLDNKNPFPTPQQWDYLRLQEGVTMSDPKFLKPGPQKVPMPPNMEMLEPMLTILQICAKSEIFPEQGVSRTSFLPVPPGPGKVMIPPRWQILEPEATILHLCAKPDMIPEQVTGLRFINITVGQVLVVWSDDNIKSKCIYTYEVAYSKTVDGPYQRVNKVDTIATIAVISPHPNNGLSGDDLVRGYYKVRAVDYWKREGYYSNPLLYTQ